MNKPSMMTSSMLQQSNQAQMNMMNQMNQMQQMQKGNMMNMNMMNSGMMQQPTQQQPNLFQQAMAGVGQPQQQNQQTFRNNNDPFSGLSASGNPTAQTTQAPTQPPQPKGPDPFAQFGLSSMK